MYIEYIFCLQLGRQGCFEAKKMRKQLSIVVMFLFLTMIFPMSNAIETEDQYIEDTNRAWTIINTFSIPESASGLAWDGTYLYCGIALPTF